MYECPLRHIYTLQGEKWDSGERNVGVVTRIYVFYKDQYSVMFYE
jgi:hypothetical protein